MKKYQLMAPGPTPVPPTVLLAMAQPIIHHRAAEYGNSRAAGGDLHDR